MVPLRDATDIFLFKDPRATGLKGFQRLCVLIIKTLLFVLLFYYSQVTNLKEKGHCYKQQDKRSNVRIVLEGSKNMIFLPLKGSKYKHYNS